MIPEHNDSDVITEKQAISIIIFGEPASKARQVFIYALVDPRDANVRYIGRSFVPEDRYKRHLIDKSETHKTRWIKQLKSVGLQPELKILDVVSEQQWSDAERQWMSKYKDLTNSCAGGYGILCPSTETRMKMRNKKLGRKLTEEHRAKVSVAHKGKKKPPRTKEHITKISESRKTIVITPNWKANLAKANMLRKPVAKSGYKGVYYESGRDKYQAHIKVGKKNIYLGRFTSAEDAAIAYNKAAIQHGWPYVGLNVI
jgi:hypothetical protein